MALLGAAWIPLWFFLNLYLQQVLGYGAFKGGAALLPMTVAIMLLMVGVTGRLVARVGSKPLLLIGLPLLAGGSLWLAFVPESGSYWTDVLPPSLLAATGMSLSYIPTLLAALSGARPRESGSPPGSSTPATRPAPHWAWRRRPRWQPRTPGSRATNGPSWPPQRSPEPPRCSHSRRSAGRPPRPTPRPASSRRSWTPDSTGVVPGARRAPQPQRSGRAARGR